DTMATDDGGSPATCELRVGGMDCASCAASIERALRRLAGVQDVRVDVVGGRVRVGYAEGQLAQGDLAGAVRRAGFVVHDDDGPAGAGSSASRRAVFTVAELHCADEVRLIEGKLGKLTGITALQFDVVSHRLTVEGTLTAPEIQRALQEIGMSATAQDDVVAPLSLWAHRGRLVMTAASGIFLVIGVAAAWLGAPRAASLGALALSTLAGGWHVVPRGLRAAMNRALDMNVLMSLAAVGAWLIGEATEAAATLFLFAVAELLESYSMDRARHAIKALMDLAPQQARVRCGAGEVMVPVAEVAVGETVIVRPGEKLAVDGEVVFGRSSVNQAPITGESVPVDKAPGDEVFAGSLNEHGMLEVRSTKRASDSTLARIAHAVEEAQGSRASSQRFVDRFARVYTPGAILLPDRSSLGRFLRHLGEIGAAVGAGDHLVSEAFYLRDPDGLGIEVYADRPRSTWRRIGRELMISTDPVDVADLLASAGNTAWAGMPAGTVIGHVHLHVGDLAGGLAFFSDALGFDRMTWRYPGALFLGAGGYHHHLGTNTWAGAGARPPADGDARLLAWTIELPTTGDVAAAAESLRAAGHPVEGDGAAVRTRDPWGTTIELRATAHTEAPR
ncbi:MAG TPA: cation transporter, partial [Gemmatimonadaceae bacterium]|nr:cation transporter [Gemmatimonadaceae bacterium]